MPTRTPVWLWMVPLFTCGCLSPVSPLAIAIKLKTKNSWLAFAGFATAWVVSWTVIGMQPEGSDNVVSSLAAGLFVLTAIAATVYSVVRAGEVHWGPATVGYAGAPQPFVTSAPHDPNAAAIANVQAVRQKRQEARAIIERDPQMARDLRIGRPDLPRHFDDGGLVDINSVPEQAFVRSLGLSEAVAKHVVEIRQQLGRFQHPDDLMYLAHLDHATYDHIKERVFLF